MDDLRSKGFADLADLPEDERIKVIAHYVRDHGLTVAVCIDDVPGSRSGTRRNCGSTVAGSSSSSPGRCRKPSR